MTDDVTDNDRLVAVFLDPEDHGFYTSRAKQWAALCPHMGPTELRIFTVLLDLCSERNTFRKLTLKELADTIPGGKAVAVGEPSKTISVSTVANAINSLAAINQITDEHGKPVRVSNKTKGEIRLAPWRSLRHECDASRNVRDALARVRGLTGEDAPRWPLGLGTAQDLVPPAPAAQDPVPTTDPAQDSVPAAQDSVPPAQDPVPTAQKAVPGPSEKPASTSENTATSETPSSSSSGTSSRTPTHTPRPRETVEDEPGSEPVTGVCVTPEEKKRIIAAVRVNVLDRATASRQQKIADTVKKAIVDLAVRCFEAGATVEEIDIALSQAIDSRTTHPYTHGTEALNTLLARKEGHEDPLGSDTPDAVDPSWIDPDGFAWPRLPVGPKRECGGACADYKGKRYIAVIDADDAQGRGSGSAFSCAPCRNAYKKEPATLI